MKAVYPIVTGKIKIYSVYRRNRRNLYTDCANGRFDSASGKQSKCAMTKILKKCLLYIILYTSLPARECGLKEI